MAETKEKSRKIRNQTQKAVKDFSSIPTTATSQIQFDVPVGQVWGISEIELEAPPNSDVTIKHQEASGNDITWDKLKGYDFPLKFKSTATDVRLQIWQERCLKIEVTNNEKSAVAPRAILHYVKNYMKEG